MSSEPAKNIAPEHGPDGITSAAPMPKEHFSPTGFARVIDLFIRTVYSLIGWGVYAGGCLLWGVSVVPVTIAVSQFRPSIRDTFNDVTRAGLRFYIRMVPFMRVLVERPDEALRGRENLPPTRILVANHQSLLDPMMLMSIEPSLSGPAKDYLFRWPGLGASLRLARFYPSQDTGRGLLETMRSGVKQAVAQGESVLFFPEGTRSRSGEIGAFRHGAFRMAVEHGLPIQPIVIDGIHDTLPAGVFLVRNSKRVDVRIVYLDPIEVERNVDGARNAARDLSKRVHEQIEAELGRLRAQRNCEGGGR
jgi:1-acyl-sn-glycerol-3-phosphate acyltransferase